MKKKTYVAIILDRSGSMASIRDLAIQNYNEQVQQMKENSKDQDIFCSFVTFNGDVFEHCWTENANNLLEATRETYVPSGSTAYFDALYYTITKLQEVKIEEGEDVAFLVQVISDGEDNASRHSTPNDVKRLVAAMEETGKWTFAFMGCSKQALEKVARETGIKISNMAAWDSTDRGRATKGLARNRASLGNYYSMRSMGESVTECLYSADASACADFTADDDDLDSVVSGTTSLPQVPQLPINTVPVVSKPFNKLDLKTNLNEGSWVVNKTDAERSAYYTGNRVDWTSRKDK